MKVHEGVTHEMTIKGVIELVIRRGDVVGDLEGALALLDDGDPIIDFTLDETGDTLYLLVGGDRT